MKIGAFSCSLKNLKERPNEDYCLVSEKYPIFSIADGVSRTRNPDGIYPDPSGARLAAELFCQESVASLESHFEKASLETLREVFFNANFAIRLLNIAQGIPEKLDYLVNDYFGTCGVAAFIKGNILYYGYLGDCGVRIYNQKDFLKLISVNDVGPPEEYRDSLTFNSKEERWRFWRKVLRNRPEAGYPTYGVFTGEPEVECYYHLGEAKLASGDLIFLYSDGFLQFIEKAEFRELFRVFKGKELEDRIEKFVEKEIVKNPGDKTLTSILVD